MINLSTLKKGDTVKFRCGGEAVVVGKKYVDSVGYYVSFQKSAETEGVGNMFPYSSNGTGVEWTSLLDIVEIIPAPFDINMVKVGEAFEFTDIKDQNNQWYYIYAGKCPLTSEGLWASKSKGDDRLVAAQILPNFDFSLAVRCPEKNIK